MWKAVDYMPKLTTIVVSPIQRKALDFSAVSPTAVRRNFFVIPALVRADADTSQYL